MSSDPALNRAIILDIWRKAEETATSVDGRIDRSLMRKLVHEMIVDELNRSGDVIALAEAFARDSASSAVQGRRNSNRLRIDIRTGKANFKRTSFITVAENEDVLVIKATEFDWAAAMELHRRNLSRQNAAHWKWEDLVAQMIPAIGRHRTTEAAVIAEFDGFEEDRRAAAAGTTGTVTTGTAAPTTAAPTVGTVFPVLPEPEEDDDDGVPMMSGDD